MAFRHSSATRRARSRCGRGSRPSRAAIRGWSPTTAVRSWATRTRPSTTSAGPTAGPPTPPSTSTPRFTAAGSGERFTQRCYRSWSARGSTSPAPESRCPTPRASACTSRSASRPVGTYERVGFKLGSWWGVGWWLMQLRDQPDGLTPAEPGPPARLEAPVLLGPSPPTCLQPGPPAGVQPGPPARLQAR